MPGGQLFRIGWAILGLLVHASRERLGRGPAGPSLPEHLRSALERLGPTFVKLGQALSLRRDLLPEAYVAALRDLQDRVAPFPSEEAQREIERELGVGIAALFIEFDAVPMAAASIAQVHRARLHDGRAVIVKVRRPGIRPRIDRDMRTLIVLLRAALVLAPALARYRPVRLAEEIWVNLRRETDFRQEARNTRRFAEAFKDWTAVHVPAVVDDLYAEAVLVQEMSGGRTIDDPAVAPEGSRLAQVLVDAYLHQFFRIGLFHGDPHPGNLFIMADGRICFHDFGLVGFLDRGTRRSLGMFLQAFVRQDAGWMLDAAVDLGLLGGAIDRTAFMRGIEEILADYVALPLKDWSIAEALLRVARLGSGENFLIPYNLVVLMRAMFLVENALRTLDPALNVLDSLIARGEATLKALAQESASSAALAHLKYEAALTMQDLPALLGAWLHRVQREGGGPLLVIRHEGLESLEAHLDRTGNRLALAMVTLGLYVAASLLMLHSAGPCVLGGLPLFALLGYALALWLSFRLVRAIAHSGRL